MSEPTQYAHGRYRGRGTRFRLYPQSPILESIHGPETVWIGHPAGSIGPGPSDNRMYVVDAVGKDRHYEFPFLPAVDRIAKPSGAARTRRPLRSP
jgi:hypothetical protein